MELGERAQTGDISTKDEGVDLMRPFIGVERLEIQHVANNRMRIHDACSPEDLPRHPGDFTGLLHVVHLRQRDLRRLGPLP